MRQAYDASSTNHRRGGFTLVELLVVISVIALLIGILMPAIGSARGTARQIVGGSIHKNLTLAQITYAADNKGVYGGLNGSNARYQTVIRRGSNNIWIGVTKMWGNQTSTTPTTVFDWISPTLGDEMQFSENRARRTQQIFNDLACPSATRIVDELYGGAPDIADFDELIVGEGFNQTSFLSPVSFFEYPTRQFGTAVPSDVPTIAIPGAAGKYRAARFENPARAPMSFRPNMNLISRPSAKILVADGCRYLTEDGVLDFDVNSNPGTYGSFTTSGPIFNESTAYRRDGDNYKLSLRHGKFSAANVSRFDGSVTLMRSEELYSDPTPWFPSGSQFTFDEATPESIDFMQRVADETGEAEPVIH